MIYNEGIYNSHWMTKKLSDLGIFSRGISKHRPRNDPKLFEGGGYPLVQTGEIKNSILYIRKHQQEYNKLGLMQSKLWEAGTLCITIAANIAETAILSYPMCFPDSIVGFQAYKEQSSELFMYYVFEYIRHAVQNAAYGSAQDNINIDYLTSLEFKIPNKDYQDQIVATLSVIDGNILLNNQINDNLMQMASTAFMHYFFERTPNGKLGSIIIEHPKSNIQVGEAQNSSGNVPFFTSGDSILKWDTVLVDDRCCYLNTGGNADVKFYVGKAAYSTDTWCISGMDQLSDYLYLLLYAIKPELDKKFFQGTGLKHLQKPLLKDRPIYIPTTQELNVFNTQIMPMMTKISENTRENQRLMSIRDWLLPLLMNGQATVEA